MAFKRERSISIGKEDPENELNVSPHIKTFRRELSKSEMIVSPASHPDYLTMILECIRSDNTDKKSRQAIENFIMHKYSIELHECKLNVKLAINIGLTNNDLRQVSGSGAKGSVGIGVNQLIVGIKDELKTEKEFTNIESGAKAMGIESSFDKFSLLEEDEDKCEDELGMLPLKKIKIEGRKSTSFFVPLHLSSVVNSPRYIHI